MSKGFDSPQLEMFLFTCGQSKRTRLQLSQIYLIYSERLAEKH